MAIEVVEESVIMFDPKIDKVRRFEPLFIAKVVGKLFKGMVGEFRVFGVVYGVGFVGVGLWWYESIQFLV